MQTEIEDGATIDDYVAILVKRRVTFAATFAVVMLLFVALAYWLPPIYKAVGLVLIERPEISEQVLPQAANQLIEENLQRISSRAGSNANILALIEQNDLYADMDSEAVEDRISRFEDSMSFELLSAESVARTGRSVLSTYAFNLSFEDADPEAAAAVASALINLYLEAHEADRTDRAGRTRGFFEAEVARLDGVIRQKEEQLAIFKAENADKMPGLASLNIQVRSELKRDISALDVQIREAQARADLLGVDLKRALQDFGSGNALTALRAEYVRLSSRYSSDHPDVIRVRQQIESITGQSATMDKSLLSAEIEALDLRLAEMLTRYAESHPDVVRAKQQRAEMEQKLSNAAEASVSAVTNEAPEVQEVRTRRASVLAEIAALRDSRRTLVNESNEYRTRLALTPEVEKEFNNLQRGYENAIAEQQEMLAGLQDAKLAETLEASSQGERLTVLDSPRTPESPESPNRPAILALGFVLAIGAAIGLIAILDGLDSTVRGRQDCARLYGATPIAIVPYIDAPGTLTTRVREGMILLTIGAILVIGSVLIVVSGALL